MRCLMVALLLATPIMAHSLEGREIEVTAHDRITRFAPVSLPYEGSDPEGYVYAVDGSTGVEHPVTVREGEFTFVPEGAMPGATHVFEVRTNPNPRNPKVRVEPVEGQDALRVLIEDEHFTTYNDANEDGEGNVVKKPYLWPVLAEGGVAVTRGYPMEETPHEDDRDHPHHKSLWTAFGDVNGADFWGEGGGSGVQYSDNVTFGSGDAYGWITAENIWKDNDGNPVIDERREYRFYYGPSKMRLLDATITFTASYGEVTFGDTKEGGIMAMRVAYPIRADQQGTMTNSEEREVHARRPERLVWGQEAKWLDNSGPIGEGVYGIAIFDHPTNPRHPTRWHARKYGLVGANIFGLSYFMRGGEANGDLVVPKGETLTFNYRVAVHRGDAQQAEISQRYEDYAEPPIAKWIK